MDEGEKLNFNLKIYKSTYIVEICFYKKFLKMRKQFITQNGKIHKEITFLKSFKT